MADITDLIAQGPGRRDFSPLGELFGAYRQGVQARREDDIAAARRRLGGIIGPDGRPDFGAAVLDLLRAGDVTGASMLARAVLGARPRPGEPDRYGRYSPAPSANRRTPRSGAAPQRRGAGMVEESAGPAQEVGQMGGEFDVSPAAGVRGSLPTLTAPLPRLATREQVQAVIQDARAAMAAGKDPVLIAKRLQDLNIDVGWS